MTDPLPPELSTVRLLELPLAIYRRGEEHHEELKREFALIAYGQTDAGEHPVPKRLLALVAALQQRFGAFAAAPTSDLLAALKRGDAAVDLDYLVPAEAGDAAEEYAAMLDEADEYCRRGDLLTLATPADVVAFRRWFLLQFAVQISGSPAVSWPDYADQHPGI